MEQIIEIIIVITGISLFFIFKYIKKRNKEILIKEKIKQNLERFNLIDSQYGHLLDNINEYSFTHDQKEVIYSNAKNLLVVAGAGAGKTSTLLGKIKFLINVNKAKESDILVISFTKKSGNDIKKQINDKLNLSKIRINTFHSLGKRIINVGNKAKLSVLDENDLSKYKKHLKDTLLNKIMKEDVMVFQNFCHYLLNQDSQETLNFQSLKDYENYRSELGLKIYKNANSTKGDVLKSLEEIKIANFLYINDIEYEYEKSYSKNTFDKNHTQYKPDFYLPKYDIYIEHFGIDINGNVPQFFVKYGENYNDINKKYNDGIIWKRKLHKRNNTKLIETFSWQNHKGILLDSLKESLLNEGVEFGQNKNIINEVSDVIKIEYDILINLLLSFLNLFKSSGMDLKSFKEEIYKNRIKSFKEKSIVGNFFIIFEKMLEDYNAYLRQNNQIDFNDMLILANNYIKSGKIKLSYKYIIVDEFQDINKTSFLLLQSILKLNNANFIGVGDDRQSIYRFAGSNINLFTKIQNYFNNVEIKYIRNTFRYPQIINDITGQLMLKNKNQFNKELISLNKNKIDRPIRIVRYKDESEIPSLMMKIRKSIKGELAILSRNNLKRDYGKYDNSKYLTIHKSKGLEFDNVILLNNNSGFGGFPGNKRNNFLLNLALPKSNEGYFDEERRLFYVALTRSKNYTFLFTKINRESIFLKEIERIINPNFYEEYKQYCLNCGDHSIITTKKYFYCGNDFCNFKVLSICPFPKYKGQKFKDINDIKYYNRLISIYKKKNKQILYTLFFRKEYHTFN